MKISKEAEKALGLLAQNGYFAYVVGGCVRDSLLFTEPHDWDITTSALPSQIIACFLEYKVIETGLKYGTVTVIIDKIPIEITTYRIDGEYKDNRRPEEVLFTNKLKDDLSRRDFTMNAIACNNEIVDYFGGVRDIENKIIRTVGNSDERFSEDALRILRALRFSSQLGFEIEKSTKKSIISQKSLLKNISAERITAELKKLLIGRAYYNALTEYHEVIFEIIPEINSINEMLENSPEDLNIRLSLLLWNVKSPEKLLGRLRFDNKSIELISSIIKNKDIFMEDNKISLKKLLNKLNIDVVRAILKIRGQSAEILDEIISKNECYSLEGMRVNGNDIIKMGITGKRVGEILNMALDLIIEEKLANTRKEIMEYIVTII